MDSIYLIIHRSCKGHLRLHNRGVSCHPWVVERVEGAGRGLVASRRVLAGEVVLRDWPVVQGPLPDAGDTVCIICLEAEDSVGGYSGCSLPVCVGRAKGCAAQHKAECEVLGGRTEEDQPTKEDLHTLVAALRPPRQPERDSSVREQPEHPRQVTSPIAGGAARAHGPHPMFSITNHRY